MTLSKLLFLLLVDIILLFFVFTFSTEIRVVSFFVFRKKIIIYRPLTFLPCLRAHTHTPPLLLLSPFFFFTLNPRHCLQRVDINVRIGIRISSLSYFLSLVCSEKRRRGEKIIRWARASAGRARTLLFGPGPDNAVAARLAGLSPLFSSAVPPHLARYAPRFFELKPVYCVLIIVPLESHFSAFHFSSACFT